MCKKIISIVLTAALLFSILPLTAFSDGDKVISGTFRYSSGHDDYLVHDFESYFEYSDSYFNDSAYVYRHDLASASLALAGSAFSSMKSKTHEQHIQNFVSFVKQCGFSDISANEWYGKTPEFESIGVACASKKLTAGHRDYTLIAVGIRGANYLREWGGSGILGAEGEHEGFAAARDKAIAYVKQYIKDTGIKGAVKLWISGYSRGAAVANMTAAGFDDNCSLPGKASLKPEDIYCYTFEAPRTAMKSDADSAVYDNIHNIINPNDMITYIPFGCWGFVRYGVDHCLPTRGDADYEALKAGMLEEFAKIPNNGGSYMVDDFRYIGCGNEDMTQEQFYALLSEALATDFASSRQDYADNMQSDLAEILAIIPNIRDYEYAPVFALLLEKLQSSSDKLLDATKLPDKLAVLRVASILEKVCFDTLNESGISVFTPSSLRETIARLAPRVVNFAVKHPDLAATLLANFTVITSAHYTELEIAWMHTLPDERLAASTDRGAVSIPQQFDFVSAVFDIPQRIFSLFAALSRSLPVLRSIIKC